MPEKRLLLIGPLPRGRLEGVSIGFRNLVAGLDGDNIVVNTNWLADVKSPGKFNLARAFETLTVVLRVALAVPRVQVVYLTVSTSRFGFLRDLIVISFSRLCRRRVVGHLKGGGMRQFYLSGGPYQRHLIRWVYDSLSAMIVLGKNLKNQFRFMRDLDKLTVVANGLPADVENSVGTAREFTAPLQLLYLSNITPSKGLSDLIEAVALLRDNIGVQLHVCGAYLSDVDAGGDRSGDSFRDELQNLVARLSLGEHVLFHGTVNGDDKINMLKRSHIFVLPTSYAWEGQPISIIEAQAFGLPVVSTNFRAIPDTVIFGESAEQCQAHNPSSIVAAVTRIAANAQVYARYSQAARSNYETRFQNRIHIANMKSVLYDTA